MKTWPSWLLGSTVGAIRRTRPSTSPAPIILIRAGWLTSSLAMSRSAPCPTRSNSLRAMIENSASPLPEATAPITAEESPISPATGACTWTVPPSGRVSRASVWPAVTVSPASARISATFSPGRSGRTAVSSRAITMPEDLDDIAEAGLRRLQHRDGRALGRVGFVARRGRGRRGRRRGGWRRGLG